LPSHWAEASQIANGDTGLGGLPTAVGQPPQRWQGRRTSVHLHFIPALWLHPKEGLYQLDLPTRRTDAKLELKLLAIHISIYLLITLVT